MQSHARARIFPGEGTPAMNHSTMNDALLIYGSYGYTGELIVREALDKGLRPILAGRNEAKLKAQAAAHKLDYRAFALDDRKAVDAALDGLRVVLHCAGPFIRTAGDMAEGCLRAGAHYLDITGEISVFEYMASQDARATKEGVMLMPGTGFDVVPSDCLAAHLRHELPSATNLTLAFFSSGRASHGTSLTMVENFGHGGTVRRNGKLSSVPAAWKTRNIDFGPKSITCITIPWGDVSTAYYSTGIPNIEVFMAAPLGLRVAARATRPFGAFLNSPGVQRFLAKRIPEGGPSEAERARGYTLLWGEASDDKGGRVEARLKTPEGYTLTAQTAVHIATKCLTGHARCGFQTPSLAFGRDLILEIPGTTRT